MGACMGALEESWAAMALMSSEDFDISAPGSSWAVLSPLPLPPSLASQLFREDAVLSERDSRNIMTTLNYSMSQQLPGAMVQTIVEPVDKAQRPGPPALYRGWTQLLYNGNVSAQPL